MIDDSVPPALASMMQRATSAMERMKAEQAAREADPEYQRQQAERAAAEKRQREQDHRARLREKADAAQVPEELGLRTIALVDDPPETEALVAYREALAWREMRTTPVGRQPVIRLVVGTTGTGKSCALAWCATHHARAAEYVSAAAIVATPRNGWSTNEQAWERWLRVDLLCVDEVGVEKGDPQAIVFVLGERFNRGLATLISGNIARGEFGKRYGDERLADRMRNGQMEGREDGFPWYVAVTGSSLRNPANAEALRKGAA